MINDEQLLKLSPAELVDLGVCPTCFNHQHNNALYGDDSHTLVYKDDDIECFLVSNPRADGHLCISSIKHFHDMSETPDCLNEKMARYAKAFMLIIKEVYKCERVYLCTMCDGPNNHYHLQLIPRYAHEQRGSNNFVKPRKEYAFDQEKFSLLKKLINDYSNK